jgi:hypothetical protein
MSKLSARYSVTLSYPTLSLKGFRLVRLTYYFKCLRAFYVEFIAKIILQFEGPTTQVVKFTRVIIWETW